VGFWDPEKREWVAENGGIAPDLFAPRKTGAIQSATGFGREKRPLLNLA
jgi:hypothetical protein